MRADGFNRLPLIRMTNVNLLPQPGMSLDEIVADTDDGLLPRVQPQLEHRRPAAQLPVRHRDVPRDQGRQAGPAYRNATYTGITPEFWGSCDAVGDERSWVMLGTPNCGKGEPGQVATWATASAAPGSGTSRSGSVT